MRTYTAKKIVPQMFIGIENVKGFFIKDIASVHEVSYPYRICTRALFLHILPSKALVIGMWKASVHIDKHLLDSLGGRIVQEEAVLRGSGVSKGT